ncbi:MAG TPA: hypothetical protein VFW94_17015, partial [Candidatus Acidoferrales bacterium]|nr:hypothetical protein [Candidatus Acidoferrales bacterium]
MMCASARTLTAPPDRYTLTFAFTGLRNVKLNIVAATLALFACALASSAQDLPAGLLARGTWEFAPLVGGGSG